MIFFLNQINVVEVVDITIKKLNLKRTLGDRLDDRIKEAVN